MTQAETSEKSYMMDPTDLISNTQRTLIPHEKSQTVNPKILAAQMLQSSSSRVGNTN
jgi:hypothetical protein